MRPDILRLLRCPETGKPLRLEATDERGGRICAGWLVSKDNQHRYPIRDFIPRFVPESNYADNFGLQWNYFSGTQLDSNSGLQISYERFFRTTGWKTENMAGKWILDAGCGAGRFSEIALKAGANEATESTVSTERFSEVALKTGANVVAIDYSDAVEACYKNLGSHPNLHVLQADIYKLPFAPSTFDYVYSLGVLQHTPDVKAAFMALSKMLKKGGHLAVDVYPQQWKNLLWMKYWLRPFTCGLSAEKNLRLAKGLVRTLLPFSRALASIPVVGRKLRAILPVANYEGIYPLTPSQLEEWAILDTFDMIAPRYDQPQTAKTLRVWFDEVGFERAEVFRDGHLIGRGRRLS